uniref:Uncharacterized protein n=1 Tax=Arundo donax TaxID=35708 RepID=A0A0A9HLR6_ARUDO
MTITKQSSGQWSNREVQYTRNEMKQQSSYLVS